MCNWAQQSQTNYRCKCSTKPSFWPHVWMCPQSSGITVNRISDHATSLGTRWRKPTKCKLLVTGDTMYVVVSNSSPNHLAHRKETLTRESCVNQFLQLSLQNTLSIKNYVTVFWGCEHISGSDFYMLCVEWAKTRDLIHGNFSVSLSFPNYDSICSPIHYCNMERTCYIRRQVHGQAGFQVLD